jgi:Zn-dependent protease with chaperone function
VTAAAAALALIALAIWTLRRHGVSLFLRAHGAFEVPAERAPAAHVVLADLSLALERPRPRLFVTEGHGPAALAIRAGDFTCVGLAGPLLERLTPQEVRGALALLVALLASPGGWRRARGPEDWFAADALAKKLTDGASVTAALFALASSQHAPTLWERLLGALSPDVIALVPPSPPIVARIAQLDDREADAPAWPWKRPRPQ